MMHAVVMCWLKAGWQCASRQILSGTSALCRSSLHPLKSTDSWKAHAAGGAGGGSGAGGRRAIRLLATAP